MATRGYISWARLALPVPVIFGQAVAVAQGIATPSVSVTLTGQSCAAAQGALGGGTQRGYVSWAQLQIPVGTGTTQALTGQAATASKGTLVAVSTRGYISWARLQIPSANTVLLTGQAATAARGTLTAVSGTAQVLTGQASTAAAGTLVQGRYGPLVGIAATTAGGTLTASQPASLLTGLQATASAGTLIPDDPTFAQAGLLTPATAVALTGFQVASGYGFMSQIAGGNVTVPVQGQSATTARGAFVALPVTVALSGLSASANPGAVGTLAPVAVVGGGSALYYRAWSLPPEPPIKKPKPKPKAKAKREIDPAKTLPGQYEAALQHLLDKRYADALDAVRAHDEAEKAAKEARAAEAEHVALIQKAHETEQQRIRERNLRILKMLADLKIR